MSWTPKEKGVVCLACSSDDLLSARLDERPNAQQVPLLKALTALEEALLTLAEKNLTPELHTAWERYGKLKTLALNPGTQAEGRAALKQAVLTLVKLVF